MKNILLIISLLLTTSSFSQHFNFRNFSIEDGLPQSTIYDIHQDSKGFIWFGTQGGVAKFNGIEFVNYNQKDGRKGKTHNRVCVGEFYKTVVISVHGGY